MWNRREIHRKVAKIISLYIKVTYQLGINYFTNTIKTLVSYNESYWIKDDDDMKLEFGYVFQIYSRPLVWSRKKQKVMSLSTKEPKYHGAVNGGT